MDPRIKPEDYGARGEAVPNLNRLSVFPEKSTGFIQDRFRSPRMTEFVLMPSRAGPGTCIYSTWPRIRSGAALTGGGCYPHHFSGSNEPAASSMT